MSSHKDHKDHKDVKDLNQKLDQGQGQDVIFVIENELDRIGARIEYYASYFKNNRILNACVAWLVSFEISNGRGTSTSGANAGTNGVGNKITVQELYAMFQKRLEQLQYLFREVTFEIEMIQKSTIQISAKTAAIINAFQMFKSSVYKLFSLYNMVSKALDHHVTFGSTIKRFSIVENFFNEQTKLLVDSILLLDTDVEFKQRLDSYLTERFDHLCLTNGKRNSEKIRQAKIQILQSLLDDLKKG